MTSRYGLGKSAGRVGKGAEVRDGEAAGLHQRAVAVVGQQLQVGQAAVGIDLEAQHGVAVDHAQLGKGQGREDVAADAIFQRQHVGGEVPVVGVERQAAALGGPPSELPVRHRRQLEAHGPVGGAFRLAVRRQGPVGIRFRGRGRCPRFPGRRPFPRPRAWPRRLLFAGWAAAAAGHGRPCRRGRTGRPLAAAAAPAPGCAPGRSCPRGNRLFAAPGWCGRRPGWRSPRGAAPAAAGRRPAAGSWPRAARPGRAGPDRAGPRNPRR